jgi:hypothetical protein
MTFSFLKKIFIKKMEDATITKSAKNGPVIKKKGKLLNKKTKIF